MSARNNLPRQTTSFVGRAADAEAIGRFLTESRIVTLTGEPGVGKTRLALHVGAEVLGHHVDGVWLVELSSARDDAGVMGVVAAALGLTGAGRSSPEQIVALLEGKNALLIIDNCDHVRDAVCDLVALIARACSGVRILATSRTGLGLPIERTYALEALAIQTAADEVRPDGSLRPVDALALFADRAHALDERLIVTDEHLEEVVRICRYLEGVALATESTANHARAAKLKMIATDLRSVFGVSGGEATTQVAERSMKWAIAQLATYERRTLRRLAVFAGGWTIDSAAAVAADPFEDAASMKATLGSLVEKSLIVSDPYAPGRFRLVESIRDYLAVLPTATEDAMTAARHARYFSEFVAEADRRHYREPLRAVIVEVLPELENIRAAIDWSLVEGHDLELGCAMVAALGYVWRVAAYAEGERLIELALRVAAEPESHVTDLTRARLYRAPAEIEIRLHSTVLDLAKRSVDAYDSLCMDVMAAESKRLYGFLLHRHGRLEEAIVEISEAAVTFGLYAERRSEGRALSDLSVPVWMNGDRPHASSLHARAVDWATSIGDRREASRMGLNFAECQFHSGDVDAAIGTATEAFVRYGGADLQEILAGNLSAYFLARRSVAEAKRYALLCLGFCREISAPVARPLQHLAGAAALSGPEAHAASLQLLGFVNEQLRAMEERRDRTEQVTYDLTIEHLASTVEEAQRDALMAVGSRMTQDEAMALAASL